MLDLIHNRVQNKRVQYGSGNGKLYDNVQDMIGSGLIDQVRSLLGTKSGINIGKDTNPNWREGFTEEKHVVVPTKYGPTRGNYIGQSWAW